MNTKEPNWINWPNMNYARDLEDLYTMGQRCDAWRAFMQSETIAKLRRLKGRIIWFNKYQYFDKLLCEFDCSEKKLRATIESLMRPDHKMPVEFIRKDIYDARAWAELPLSCFAEVEGDPNEIPVIQFGLKLPWEISVDCFTLTHRIKDNLRHAIMTVAHPQIDPRFKGKRWVADQVFPRDTTRKEMETILLDKVRNECKRNLVTIV